MHRIMMPLFALLSVGCIPGLVAEETTDDYGLINGRFACEIETNIDDDLALGENIGVEWGLEDCQHGRHHIEGSISGSSCVDVAAVMTRNDVVHQCSQVD